VRSPRLKPGEKKGYGQETSKKKGKKLIGPAHSNWGEKKNQKCPHWASPEGNSRRPEEFRSWKKIIFFVTLSEKKTKTTENRIARISKSLPTKETGFQGPGGQSKKIKTSEKGGPFGGTSRWKPKKKKKPKKSCQKPEGFKKKIGGGKPKGGHEVGLHKGGIRSERMVTQRKTSMKRIRKKKKKKKKGTAERQTF